MFLRGMLLPRAWSRRRAVVAALVAAVAGLVLAALALSRDVATSRIVLGATGRHVVSATADPTRLPAAPANLASQKLAAIAPNDALSLNARMPFAAGALAPARPFMFAGSGEDRARATQCLALAAMAEAGGSDRGQRAVIQVVLNRVRHPAFAHTVCGVVFQGSERRTGCQFTFTCDGALQRRYADAAWAKARWRATQALDGQVFAAVGAATHYHTDWVYPVWSPQLAKLARIDTHLFFRWPGFWGSRDAARIEYRGGEPGIAALGFSPELAAVQQTIAGAGPIAPAALSNEVVVKHPDGGAFLVKLPARPTATGALSLGRRLCGGQGYCQVLGWSDRSAIPKGYPVSPAARKRLSFSYVIDAANDESVFYDCKLLAGVRREECMPLPLEAP